MNRDEIAARYAEIMRGLDSFEAHAVWAAVLAGRKVDEPRLARCAVELTALREEVGHRKSSAQGDRDNDR